MLLIHTIFKFIMKHIRGGVNQETWKEVIFTLLHQNYAKSVKKSQKQNKKKKYVVDVSILTMWSAKDEEGKQGHQTEIRHTSGRHGHPRNASPILHCTHAAFCLEIGVVFVKRKIIDRYVSYIYIYILYIHVTCGFCCGRMRRRAFTDCHGDTCMI